jgi:hypothetical protein
MAGYHLTEIKRGEYGELSKVAEEVLEAIDAQDQANPVMVLIELSDAIGAIEGYLDKHFDRKINLGSATPVP